MMRILVSFFRRTGAPLVVALIAAFAAIFVGPAPQAQARERRISPRQAVAEAKQAFREELKSQLDMVRPMTPVEQLESVGIFEGMPVEDVEAFEAKAATAATVGTAVRGQLKLYNASSEVSRYILKIRISTTWANRTVVFTENASVNLPIGTVLELDQNRWGEYRIAVFADTNGDGVRNNGETRVARDHFWMLKGWWSRWGTKVRSYVFTGSGGGGNPNPDPTYPAGAIVARNMLSGNRFQVRGTYNGSAYAFPSVPFQSWGYVVGFFGSTNVTAGFADTTGGAVTLTKARTLVGPASSAAPAVVWDVVDGDMTVAN